ncbi:MAG: cation diffusion facilitator family transporter [Candidatus Goldiibacteriota bacterium]|jgi:cobalt-zinc-cadmium efflux system protein
MTAKKVTEQSCERHTGHGHHHHGHSHAPAGEKGLLISIVLNTLITVVQIAGGLLSGSLALLSDAFHNLSDAVFLVISYIALLISKKSKSADKTYGYKRAEILAALANVAALFLISAFIIYMAFRRFSNPSPVNSMIMLVVAFLGFVGNGVSALLLMNDAKNNLNIKSALVHLIGDAVSSVAVIITAVVLIFKPWYFLDSVMSILISIYIIKESFSIFMESINILMQAAPRGIEKEKVEKSIYALKKYGIKDIHHIHMWEISPGNIVFDAHIVIDVKELKKADEIIKMINRILLKEHRISHSTIQLESENFNHCVTCEL